MMRFAARVEYDGAGFSGWQVQKSAVRTVQSQVEAALSRVADDTVSVITAGRTDTAVHATHQVVHFESEANRTVTEWQRGANRFLDRDVRLHWVHPVDDTFHARFSALSRSYRFVIHCSTTAPALIRDYVTHEYRPLNAQLMRLAGQALIGEHDFSSFRAAGCQAQSPIRTVLAFELYQKGPYIWFDIKANAFLQHMVRNIAGSLIEVGYGKRSLDWFKRVLSEKDRTRAGVTAEPNGLYLAGVEYPDSFSLPSDWAAISFWDIE